MDYKKQHWLPVCYLKHFAIEPSAKRSKAEIYRYGGNSLAKVKIEKECYENFCYSKRYREAVEKSFQISENLYPQIINNMDENEKLTKSHYLGIMKMLFDLHFRNTAFENKTSTERITAYEDAKTTFLSREIVGIQEKDATPEEISRELGENWGVRIVRPISKYFYSSDHPSLLFSSMDKTLFFGFLPIKPKLAIVVFNKNHIKIVSNLAEGRTVDLLNCFQASRSTRFLYTHTQIPESEKYTIEECLNKRLTVDERPYIDVNGVRASYIGYNPEDRFRFSFLRLCNS